jgi:hypothetical protein
MHRKLCNNHEHFNLIINRFKYKCETCQIFIHPFKNIVKCKLQLMRNGLNTFKMNDATYVQMLIIQEL